MISSFSFSGGGSPESGDDDRHLIDQASSYDTDDPLYRIASQQVYHDSFVSLLDSDTRQFLHRQRTRLRVGSTEPTSYDVPARYMFYDNSSFRARFFLFMTTYRRRPLQETSKSRQCQHLRPFWKSNFDSFCFHAHTLLLQYMISFIIGELGPTDSCQRGRSSKRTVAWKARIRDHLKGYCFSGV